jgi:hypothetical protein
LPVFSQRESAWPSEHQWRFFSALVQYSRWHRGVANSFLGAATLHVVRGGAGPPRTKLAAGTADPRVVFAEPSLI